MLMNVDFFIRSCQTELQPVSKVKKCVERKKSKERLAVLLAASMDGSEKIIPLKNGKSLKPQCMENCKSLPLFNSANSKARMIADICEKMLKSDRIFSKQNHKVALIVDKLHTIL